MGYLPHEQEGWIFVPAPLPEALAPGFRGPGGSEVPGSRGWGRSKCAHGAPPGVFQGVFQAGYEAGIPSPHAALVGKYRNR